MSGDLFGPTPEQTARADQERARRRFAARVDDALADGDPVAAARLLDAAVARLPEPASVEQRLPLPEAERPEAKPPTAAAVRRAETARRKAAARAVEDEAKVTAGRKAKATIALVLDTLGHLRSSDGGHAWPEQPFAPPARNVNPLGAAGNFLRPQFMNDPALTPDEAALALVKMIRRARRPIRLMVQPFDDAIGAGRSGPYRTSADEGEDGIELLDRAGGRGFVRVPLGLTKFRPDGDDDDELLVSEEIDDPENDYEENA